MIQPTQTTQIKFKHPEQRKGEIFFTNEPDPEPRSIMLDPGERHTDYPYKRLRRGEVAYQIDRQTRQLVPAPQLVPVFVEIAELREMGVSPEAFAKNRYGGNVEVLFEE